jgi:hypothetical protein
MLDRGWADDEPTPSDHPDLRRRSVEQGHGCRTRLHTSCGGPPAGPVCAVPDRRAGGHATTGQPQDGDERAGRRRGHQATEVRSEETRRTGQRVDGERDGADPEGRRCRVSSACAKEPSNPSGATRACSNWSCSRCSCVDEFCGGHGARRGSGDAEDRAGRQRPGEGGRAAEANLGEVDVEDQVPRGRRGRLDVAAHQARQCRAQGTGPPERAAAGVDDRHQLP